MTDKQFLGIIIGFVGTALSGIAATLIALLINNSRLTDVKETLRAESKADIAALRTEFKTDIGESNLSIATLRSEMASMREAILRQMSIYQMDIISKIAALDNRITRLER
jgi:hypothetical protein